MILFHSYFLLVHLFWQFRADENVVSLKGGTKCNVWQNYFTIRKKIGHYLYFAGLMYYYILPFVSRRYISLLCTFPGMWAHNFHGETNNKNRWFEGYCPSPCNSTMIAYRRSINTDTIGVVMAEVEENRDILLWNRSPEECGW